MRETKFRAWDKIDKRMIIHEQKFIPLKVTSIGILRLDERVKENRWELIDNARFELMQYIGIKDVNGVEIYEGDIIKINDDLGFYRFGNHIVSYVPCVAHYMFEFGKTGVLKEICARNKIYEVIGNIYEDADLLIKEN